MNNTMQNTVVELAEETIKASVKYLVSSVKENQENKDKILTILASADSDTIKIRKINELLNSKK